MTIPEENSNKPKMVPPKKSNLEDNVKHKGFWAAGLVALVAFSFAFSLPQQLTGFLKAELFDDFKVIPETENQKGNEFFADPQTTPPENTSESESIPPPESKAQEDQAAQPQSGSVAAEDDAVPIQIDPIDPPSEEAAESETPPLTEDESEILEPVAEEVVEDESSALQTLIEGLSAQLDELKKDSQQKDEQIQALMAQLQNPSTDFHPSAENQETNTLPINTGNQIQTGEGEYKYNTHTVTVNPYDVLAQNRTSASQIEQQALQANLTQNTAAANQNNLSLSGVQNQPATGPGEALLFALVLSAAAILGFGIYRSSKA